MIRVRFAPSPTGYLHIGGARTALFNWMYARSQGGQFILRIEDTDLVRSKKEYYDEILDSLQWLGLKWDELYKQSDRFEIYHKYAKELLDKKEAYSQDGAILIKMPRKEIKIFDLIRDGIVFDTAFFYKRDEQGQPVLEENGQQAALKDEVLIKADGSPAYNFSCVVDDALMGMTHVIRGEDHISNTPKQIIIYEALGFQPPKFAHLPLIMDPEGGRLSKRHGAVAVSEYRRMGFLPEAIVNYLMLLGWSPGGNEEMIRLSSAIKKFSIKKINKTGAIFSMEKLRWMNAQYIKQMDTPKLTKLLIPLLEEKGIDYRKNNGKNLEDIVNLYKGRLVTLMDFLDWTAYIFEEDVTIAPELKEKYLSKDFSKEFHLLAERLGEIQNFSTAASEEVFRSLVVELGIKVADLVHPVRVALTGNAVGPGLFETMTILGKEKTIKRLRSAA